MRRFAIFILILIILAAVVAGYEFVINLNYTRHVNLPANMLASSTDTGTASSTSSGTTLADIFGLTDPSLFSPASSTVNVSSWLSYSNAALGYSIRYPANLLLNTDINGNPVLSFPKDRYFHWPLLDDVKVTITASSTCPAVQGPNLGQTSITTIVNGYSFTRTEGGDVAAGNIYRELAYDMKAGNTCYHIDLLDHGANGAGLYVGDQSLINSYDAAHTVDLGSLVGVFNAMVNTFRLTGNVL